ALVAVHAGGIAGFISGPNYDCVAKNRHRDSKGVTSPGVGGFEISLLAPIRPVPHEDIGRTGISSAVVTLVAVDSRGVAVLVMCADHNCVAKNRNPVAERVHRPSVGSFKICLLAPVGDLT